MNNSADFTKGKILSPLIRFTGPILLAMLLQNLYGAVDMLIVGQFAAAADVSAISTGAWIIGLVISLVAGLSMGTTVQLGQYLGEGRPEEAGKTIASSIWLFAGLGLLLTAAIEIFATPFLRVMQIPEEAFAAALDYVRICGFGLLFTVAYNVLGGIFRGIGNARMPLITVAIASVVNIFGDLLLVAVLRMAAAGAAIATVGAQALSVVISLLIIRRQQLPFRLSGADLRRPELSRILRVLKLGLPIAFQDLLVSISFLVITAIVNTLGVVASAGVGIAERLCGFVMLVPSSFSQSMSAFVAQNVGARKPERARKALLAGIGSSLAVGVVLAYFSFFHGNLLSSLFTRDPELIAASADYLKSYAIDCLCVSIFFCMVGYFSGCGKTFFVMLQGLIGAFCVRVPVSFFMSRVRPVSLFLVGLATPASSLVQILLCLGYFLWLRKREEKAAG